MAGSEVVYTVPNLGPVLYERGRAVVTTLPVYRDGELVVPTAGTLTVVDRYGTLVLTGTVTVPVDRASASMTIPTTTGYGEGYVERWTLTLDGIVRSFRRSCVVARFEVAPPLGEAELLQRYPELLVDVSGFSTTLQPWLDSAWSFVVRRLVSRGDFVDIVVDSSDLYEWYENEALSRIYAAIWRAGGNQGERLKTLWDYHAGQSKAMETGLRVTVDRDRDGNADSLAKVATAQSIHVNLPWSRHPYNGGGKW